MSRDQFEQEARALIVEREPGEGESHEIIEQLREIVHSEETTQTWEAMRDILDRASEEAQRHGVAYVTHLFDEDRFDYTRYNHIGGYASPKLGYLRGPSRHDDPWRAQIIAGQDAPKFDLIRVASFHSTNLGNTQLMNLFECPSLRNVVLLDLEGTKPGGELLQEAWHARSV